MLMHRFSVIKTIDSEPENESPESKTTLAKSDSYLQYRLLQVTFGSSPNADWLKIHFLCPLFLQVCYH